MVSNPEVAALIGDPPLAPEPPDRDRFWHIVYRVGALIAVTALVVAAVAGAWAWSATTQSDANTRATAAQSKCINNLLGDRSGLLTSLISDLTGKSSVQSKALKALLSAKTAVDAEAALSAYQAAEDQFTSATGKLVAYANAHPLGHC